MNKFYVESIRIETPADEAPDVSYLNEPYHAERKAAYERGAFHFIGLRAVASIRRRTEAGGYGVAQQIRSAGLWGIESDSHGGYLAEVAQEQLAELRAELEALGVDLVSFDQQSARALANLDRSA